MKIMPYGSLINAERNNYILDDIVPIIPLSDTELSFAIRGVECYERCVQKYLGKKKDLGLWVGEKYVMYGTHGSFGMGGGYEGVRKKLAWPGGWTTTSLSDRDEECYSTVLQTATFEVAWASVLRSYIFSDFLNSKIAHKKSSLLFFDRKMNPKVSLFDMRGKSYSDYLSSDGMVRWGSIEGFMVDSECYESIGINNIHIFNEGANIWFRSKIGPYYDLSWFLGEDIEGYIVKLFERGVCI